MKIKMLSILVSFSVISGCSMSPNYINEGESSTAAKSSFLDPVKFKATHLFVNEPPQCIAVLPVTKPNEVSEEIDITDEQLDRLQWNLYSHLAPYPYRDVEITTISTLLESHPNSTDAYVMLSEKLECDALLLSELTTYNTEHFGFFSRTSIGVEMELIRAHDGAQLWHGSHIARSHAGSIPLSPIGLAEGIVSATENTTDEQLVKVEDELFRRLLSTWDRIPSHQLQSTQLAEQKEVVKEEKKEPFSLYVAVKQLFLRTGPGTKYEPKDVLKENEALVIMNDEYSPWVQVKDAEGQLGFVNQKYLNQQPLVN